MPISAFICDAIRTPIGRYGGSLAQVRADDLAAVPIKALMERNPGADWSALDDVILGSANQAGEDNRNLGRMALLLAGVSHIVPGATVNRLCGSGMQAVADAARVIASGEGSFLLAGGAESMSRAPFVMGKSVSAFARNQELFDTTIGWRFVNPAMRAAYGVDALPELPKDVTDRNRTSPFAFTGNKFEFRAPGSSISCSGPMAILNTIVGEAMHRMAAALEPKTGDFNAALQDYLSGIIKKHKRIIFNGDGYNAEWREEAARRGLANSHDTMTSLKAYLKAENIEFLANAGVYSKVELESRYEIYSEEYHRKIRIEGEVALNIVRGMITPIVIQEYKDAVAALKHAKDAGVSVGNDGLMYNIELLGRGLEELTVKTEKMAHALGGLHEEILEAMSDLRKTVDKLELIVADELWPLPKYREMLFIH